MDAPASASASASPPGVGAAPAGADPAAAASLPAPAFPLNPGTIEDLHKRAQTVMPMFFEGGKLMVNKGLSNHFQVSHTLTLSQLSPSGYRFGATYVGQNPELGPSEACPLLLADCDPSGNLNANLVHSFNHSWRAKAIAQIQQGKWQSAQITADYRQRLYTASLTLGNPDLIHGTGVAVLHYLRALTDHLSVGAELAYQANPQLPGGHLAVLSAVGRYATEDSSLACTIGNGGQWHATFYQKCSDALQIGVEMETNLKMQESSAAIGYEVDVGQGNLVVRGSVDSNWLVKSVVEKRLLPLPFTLALCSMINHKKNQYQFGCGLIIG